MRGRSVKAAHAMTEVLIKINGLKYGKRLNRSNNTD